MRFHFVRYSLLSLFSLSLAVFANVSIGYAFDCNTAVNINVPILECQALDDLYISTDGPNWITSTNRHTDTDICTWYGISCGVFSGNAKVIGIGSTGAVGSLSNNNLIGTLPANLADLIELRRFILDFNDLWGTLSPDRSAWIHIHTFSLRGMANNSNMPLIGGPLPGSWSAWGSTIQKFAITDNRISGQFPTTWGNRSVIEEFDVHANQIAGQLPQQWGWSTIKKFDVSTNQLNGPLPSLRGSSWAVIEDFDVGFNSLAGPLPSQFSNRGATIESFNVMGNQFVGPLPSQWSSRVHVKEVNLSFNPLNASLPSGWSSWGEVEKFRATHSQLIGTLPSSWYNRSSIKEFGVNINNLVGLLPDAWYTWTGIETFSVLQNQLVGPLPSSWSGWGGHIKYFWAHNNQFDGPLPPQWSSRGSTIREFSVFNNQIAGYLPASWISRSNIQSFQVSNNRLIGSIPTSWSLNRPNTPPLNNYMNFQDNCLQTNGYPSLVVSWLNSNANRLTQYPSNYCNYTLTYAANTGGSISGSSVQSIPYGGTGTYVTAVPGSGCIFNQWSDGSTANPRIDGGITGSATLTGSFLCSTIPMNGSGMVVAAISYWPGKVNQHFDIGSMSRQTDPTGTRGGGSSTQRGANGRGDRPLAYCRIFWPATISVTPINTMVTIRTRMKMGNTMPYYSSTRKAYRCVQSLSPNSNPLPNRYSNPTVPITKDVLPVVNAISSVKALPSSQDKSTIMASPIQGSFLKNDKTAIDDGVIIPLEKDSSSID